MTFRASPDVVGADSRALAAKLEPDAIGVAQDAVIGMASSAPGVSVGLTLAALTTVTAYGGGAVIVVTAVPVLVIANAYRRLNLWTANCGASFEWVGRSISPYLGLLTGWLMVAAYITGSSLTLGILPFSAAAFLGWVICKSSEDAAASQNWSLLAVLVTGIALMLWARFGLKPAFFAVPRESFRPGEAA